MRKYDLNSLLKSYITGGIITIDDALTGKETAVKKILKEKHQYEIYFSEAKKVWETYIQTENGRKRVQRKSREDLEGYLLNHYEEEERTSVSFEDLYDEFMEYKSKMRAETTVNAYVDNYRKYYMNSDIVKRPLAEITKTELEMWLSDAVKTCDMDYKKFHKFSVVFKQLYEYAKVNQYVTENPFNSIDYEQFQFRKTRRKVSTAKAFSKDEAKAVCEEAIKDFKDDCVPLGILFIFQTGIRSGEAAALKWNDIDFDSKTMMVQRLEREFQEATDFRKLGHHRYEIIEDTKGKFGARTVDLSDDAIEILNMLKEFYNKKEIDSEWLFTHRNGKIHYRALDLRIRKYCRNVGIQEKSLHKCRATYISLLRDAGMSFEKIAEEVGHKQIQTTMNNYSFDVRDNEENRRMLNSALKF